VARILIVDDEPKFRGRLAGLLRRPGHQALTASDADESLDLATREPLDLIILNASLPRMSGYELYGHLRARRATRDVPVLLVASGDSPLVAGEDNLVSREDLTGLRRRVEEILAGRKARGEFDRLFAAWGGTFERGTEADELAAEEKRLLREGGLLASRAATAGPDPVTAGAAEYAALLQSSLTAAQAAKVLGVEVSRVRQRLLSRPPTLYGIKDGRTWRLPRFQFDGRRVIPGVDRIWARLDPALHPLTVHRWFHEPDVDLSEPRGGGGRPLSPRDWLRLGHPSERLERIAENL